jgi:hypothetical protein
MLEISIKCWGALHIRRGRDIDVNVLFILPPLGQKTSPDIVDKKLSREVNCIVCLALHSTKP